MPEETHAAGSWLGDLTNEWKTAKPPEKVMIVGAIVAVIFIALYLHGKSKAPNQPGAQDTSGLSGIPANFQQGAPGGTPGGSSTPAPAPTPKPPASTGTPKPPTKAPVNKQPTTVTKTYAGGTKKPSTPKPPASSPYAHLTMKNAPSPSYERVYARSIEVNQYRGEQDITARARAQRNDILQLRKEQAAPQRRPLH